MISDSFDAKTMLDSHFFNTSKDMSGLQTQHPETEYRVKKVSEKFIESIHLMVNEPSVGLFRVHEHVKRSVPQLVNRKIEMQSFHQQVNGVCYDLDYSIRTVKSMRSIQHFTIIQECLRSAIASKQNLDQAKSQRKMKKNPVSTPIDEEPVIVTTPQEVEGFICPNCMQIWKSQEELLKHWQKEHNISINSIDQNAQQDDNTAEQSKNAELAEQESTNS